MDYILIPCPVTGQTPLFSSLLQPWAHQFFNDSSIECYCLDAPSFVPTGNVKFYARHSGAVFCQDQFVSRNR